MLTRARKVKMRQAEALKTMTSADADRIAADMTKRLREAGLLRDDEEVVFVKRPVPLFKDP